MVSGPAAPALPDAGFEAPSLASGACDYDPVGTTATSSSAGGVTGYFEDSKIEQGYTGTAILQDTKTYTSQGGSISGVYPERFPMATDTVYQDTAATVPETTSYSYTWQGTTVMPQSITTTLPTVTSGQNGSGTAISSTVYVDAYGRVTWSKDGDGFLGFTAYDPNGTGGIVKQIQDVNTADTGDFSNLPSGWTTPTGGGLELITTDTVDNLGRTTVEQSPNENKTAGTGNVTYTVYNDQTHEVRTYPGWHQIPSTSTYTTTGPVTITREYRDPSSQASGQATASGTQTTLTDTTGLSSGSYIGLSIYAWNGTDAGQIATVTAYNSSTHTLTFTPAFSASTGTSTQYVLYVPLYEETLTIAPPVESTSTPSGGETISSANIQSLSRDLTNAGGETVELDQYPTLGGATYSQSSTYLGTSGTNFYATYYGFDDRGRQVHEQAPTGTITDLVYDGLGRLLSSWTGTNDAGATWSNPGAGGGSNNMIKTEDDFYDTQTAPIPPTLTNTTSGGSLAATTYYVRVTYLMASGETAGSIETSINVASSHLLVVDSPASVTGATTYNVYVSTSAGAEVLQNASPISIGTNWTEPSTGLISGAAVPVDMVGDGNLSEVVDHPNDGSPDRITLNYPDWRDRIVATKSGAQAPAVETAASPAVNRPLVVYTLDNLDESTEMQQYNGDGVMLSYSSGVPVLPTPAPTLVAESTASYDLLGQQYQTTTYSVTGGSPSTYGLVTDSYRDARGDLIETINPGGLVDKSAFDGAGRDIADYVTDGAGGTSYADPVSLTSDHVLSENLTSYDADGNPTLVTGIEADQNNTTTGALPTVTTNNEDRASYAASYYDLADRLTATEAVGTNGGSSWTRPSSPDSRDDTHLVTSYGYAADNVQTVTITGAPTGGTFTLSFNGHTTVSIAYNASASTVTSDLAALTGVGTGNVAVTQVVEGTTVGPYVVRFMGTLAGVSEPAITATSSLTGGTSPAVTPVVIVPGGDAGYVQTTTDPRNVVSLSDLDMLGRTITTIAGFSTGVPSSSTDQTTEFTYDGDNNETSETALMPSGTNSQSTDWVYGVTTSGTHDSDITSNDLLKTVEYPTPSTGVASTSSSNDVVYSYNLLGEAATMSDQNGSTHTYSHSVLGQETADAVTTVGSGVSGTIRLHAFSYTALGEPQYSTSYSGTTPTPTPTNQVLDVYNGLGQLTQEYQAHSGAVVTTPTPTASPSVQYAYAGLGSSSQNYSRQSSITYPDGEVINLGYNNSTLDNAISRVDFLSDSTAHIVDYKYLGLSTVASAADGNGVTLSYFTSGSSASDSGDQYTGLDRFDRIIEQKYATTTPTPTTTDDFTYAFDRDNNVLYQDNMLKSTQSLLYHPNSGGSGDDNTAYDPLSRETAYRQGTLSASGNNGTVLDTVTTASHSQTYSLDALGNQASVNSQNELTATGDAYNNDGDQTETSGTPPFVYDAWNQLVSYSAGSGSSAACETMNYDALGREITDSYCTATAGTFNEDKYYSGSQILENSCVTSCGCGCGCTTTNDKYVWGPDYVNDLVLRDETINGGSATRTYAQHDMNFDVTALVSNTGAVNERFAYDPYGDVTVLTASWGASSDTTWQVRFQGMWLDNTTGFYQTHFRQYNPSEARWMQADPAGYIDGSSLFQAFESKPTCTVDASGLHGTPARTPIGPRPPTPQPTPPAKPPEWQGTVRELFGWIGGGAVAGAAVTKTPAGAAGGAIDGGLFFTGYYCSEYVYDWVNYQNNGPPAPSQPRPHTVRSH